MLCRIFFYLIFLHLFIVNQSRMKRHRQRKSQRNNASVCYEEIGCILTTEEWYHKKFRPVNVLPLPRHTIKTNFLLISLNCTSEKCSQSSIEFHPILDSYTLLEQTKTENGVTLTLFIHDFTSYGQTGWIRSVAVSILTKYSSDHFLISVDWESGANPPLIQAAANARVVALEIVYFLKKIQLIFWRFNNVTLIGHGLGAHIAGYVGADFPVSFIRGLDPTGPFFDNMPSEVVLDKVDAAFVEIIHTDTDGDNGQGISMATGSVDLFINKGCEQPGCSTNTSLKPIRELEQEDLKPGLTYPGCSHKRSFRYLFEALLDDVCEFIGFFCDNEKDLYEGKCMNCLHDNNREITCYKVDLQVDESFSFSRNDTSFFLQTNKFPPYCMQPYIVVLNLRNPTPGKSPLVADGYLEMFIVGQNQKITFLSLNKMYPRKLVHGQNHTFFAYGDHKSIDVVLEVKVKWFSSTVFCIFCNNEIYISNFTIITVKYPKNKTDISPKNEFCGTQFDSGIQHLTSKQYKRCYPLEKYESENDRKSN